MTTVVHRCAGVFEPTELVDTSEAEWKRRCEDVVLDALQAAQRAFLTLEGAGGRLVFVLPSISLTGAAGLAPLTAALEGVRALAKSAARQWAEYGITVNCVAVGQGHEADVEPVVELLSSAAAAVITGQTIVVDGGQMMLP